jgi:hypothetical protein
VETYGVAGDGLAATTVIEVHAPSEVYRGDDYAYWASAPAGCALSPRTRASHT